MENIYLSSSLLALHFTVVLLVLLKELVTYYWNRWYFRRVDCHQLVSLVNLFVLRNHLIHLWVRIRWTERFMYGGSCTMNQKLKWTLLFSFCNNAYKEYTGLLFIYLIARYDPQIVRYDRRNVRYDPRAQWDGSRYDHTCMPCPLRSLARFFRWRISRVCNRKPFRWRISRVCNRKPLLTLIH